MSPHSNNRKSLVVSRKWFVIISTYGLLLTTYGWCKPKLAPRNLEGIPTEDLSAPFNLQAVVVNKSVTLSWEWSPPDPAPAFDSFGYEIYRDSAVITIVPETSYTDFSAPIGMHTYKVRV